MSDFSIASIYCRCIASISSCLPKFFKITPRLFVLLNVSICSRPSIFPLPSNPTRPVFLVVAYSPLWKRYHAVFLAIVDRFNSSSLSFFFPESSGQFWNMEVVIDKALMSHVAHSERRRPLFLPTLSSTFPTVDWAPATFPSRTVLSDVSQIAVLLSALLSASWRENSWSVALPRSQTAACWYYREVGPPKSLLCQTCSSAQGDQ